MINSVELKNFGPIEQLDWQNLGNINLIIGNNGCGKSFILKALYSAMKTIEEYKRGDNPETDFDILWRKLYWTFQAKKIGDLVSNRSEELLFFKILFDDKELSYLFDRNTEQLNGIINQAPSRSDNSIYLPAKEILSLFHIILYWRRNNQLFGFDDTYVDLAEASSLRGSNTSTYSKKFNQMLGGKIEYDYGKERWYFIKGEQRFTMGETAEGIKKIAILDTLLTNGYLNENSIVFIDEPESNLHPTAISQLLDIIAMLAEHGMQFFIASHSYFVIKKLFLIAQEKIAQEKQLSIPVLSYQDNEWVQSDLKDDMPDNPIVDESIRLYKEEIGL